MLALNEVIALFYPDKSYKERAEIQVRCENKGIDYDAKAWLEVSFGDLRTNEVKDNLILTFYYNQDSYYGVIGEILNSLEIWSNGVLNFPDLDEENNSFYEHYYGITGFTFFPFLTPTTQIYLLGSRFLLFANIWGVSVIPRIQQYFSRFCLLDILKRDAFWFSEAIRKNSTPIESNLTVGNWVEKNQGNLNDSILQEALNKITELYILLRSEKIWSDLEFSTCSHSKTGPQDKIDIEELYLHRLKETRNLTDWITDHVSIAEWCRGRSIGFVKKLLQIVKEKLPLDQHEDNIVNLVTDLENEGFDGIVGVVYFNESNSQFEWNPELLN